MKKVLIVQSGDEFSNGVFEFAKRLNEREPILLTCFLLPEFAESRTSGVYAMMGGEHDKKVMSGYSRRFKELCKENNIACTIHTGVYGSYVPQIVKETIYADLLIVGSEIFFNDFLDVSETYLGETLHKAECPVLVVPEHYNFPANIILSYNENPSAAYAIRQFSYLFPFFAGMPAQLVYASSKERDIPHQEKIEELARAHFSNLQISELGIVPERYFTTWLTDIPNPILVAGAYDRAMVFELFKKSFAKNIIDEHRVPVFIAHK